jgi:hypothetical protein
MPDTLNLLSLAREKAIPEIHLCYFICCCSAEPVRWFSA